MSQVERPEYTPEQAILMAMKTLRSTHPDERVLAKIDEIEEEVKAREAGEAQTGARKPGRHARRKLARKQDLADA